MLRLTEAVQQFEDGAITCVELLHNVLYHIATQMDHENVDMDQAKIDAWGQVYIKSNDLWELYFPEANPPATSPG